jgi:hypothetical protein
MVSPQGKREVEFVRGFFPSCLGASNSPRHELELLLRH